MTDNSWAVDMDSLVYSLIKAKTEKSVKAIYPYVFYTTLNASPTEAEFPTIYIHQLGAPETDGTLEGDEIQALTFTYEVQIKSNDDADTVNEVFTYILNAFKSIRFVLQTNVSPTFTDGVYTGTYRFRRSIAKNDILK